MKVARTLIRPTDAAPTILRQWYRGERKRPSIRVKHPADRAYWLVYVGGYPLGILFGTKTDAREVASQMRHKKWEVK